MTVEQMGYVKDGKVYVKHIENYKITLFPTKKGFMRRIILNNEVIDIRKVVEGVIEKDKTFLKILQNLDRATVSKPISPQKEAGKERFIEDEIHLEVLNEVNKEL